MSAPMWRQWRWNVVNVGEQIPKSTIRRYRRYGRLFRASNFSLCPKTASPTTLDVFKNESDKSFSNFEAPKRKIDIFKDSFFWPKKLFFNFEKDLAAPAAAKGCTEPRLRLKGSKVCSQNRLLMKRTSLDFLKLGFSLEEKHLFC